MEPNTPNQIVTQIGLTLKKLRKDRQLNLQELAELTGVSKLTLGNIERGETNPTLGVLWKISTGLSLPLMSLFSTASNVTLSQAGKGLRIVGEQKNWVIEPIFQTTINGVEMYRAYLQPSSIYQPEKHHSDTTEIVSVMTGTITMQVNENLYILNQYDSINFKADGIHTYINNSDSIAVLHIVLKYGI